MSDFPDWGGGGGGGGSYLSLTGPGQTATPGALTQAGEFTVTAIDATLDVGASTPLNGSINLQSTTGEVTVTALGFTVATDGVGLDAGTGNVQLDTQGQVLVNTGGLEVLNGVFVQYNTGGSGPDPDPGILLQDNGTGANAGFFVFAGNPNGHINPGGGANGGVCIDTSTPQVWQWHTLTSTWIAL